VYTSPQIDQLAAALASAQAEFSAVPKGSNNPFFKSKYAALPEVVASATPVLAKYGLAVTQLITVDSDMHGTYDGLTTTLLHSSGQYISTTMRLHLPKIDPQGQGSAVTYARRYSYMAILGLVADEDDDGNSASVQPSQASKSATDNSLSSKVAAAASKSSSGGQMITEGMAKMIWAITHKSLNWDDAKMFDYLDAETGHRVGDLKELTFAEAKSVIDKLKSIQEN
jgi:ERF superfamily